MPKILKITEKKSVKKTDTDSDCGTKIRCPMHRLINLLTGPWTAYILWLIQSQGPQRFGQLKKHMPKISAKVLTGRLRMLEEEEIIHRHQEEDIPPKVTYSLTKRGKQLDNILDEINKLAKKWYSS